MAGLARQQQQHQEVTFKILVLGDAGVGKTSLISVFCDGEFDKNHMSTIAMDCRDVTIALDGQNIVLRLWDTAGQERFRTLTTAYYRGAHGIMLVYDISKEETFSNLDYWLQNLKMMAPDVMGTVVVGNKTDKASERAVKTEKARRLADARGVELIETSTKNNENVEKAFQALAKATLKGFLNKGLKGPSRGLDRPHSLFVEPTTVKHKKKCGC